MKILLASSSPRRKDLIHQIHWEAQIEKSDFHEVENLEDGERRLSLMEDKSLFPFKGPDLVTAMNAWGKAHDVAERTKSPLPVVGADTIVTMDGKILGKPKDKEDAFSMLSFLSGKTHEVKTAVALLYKGKTSIRVVTTKVHFRRLTSDEIRAYIETGEPMDKAGAYGIQGMGTLLVTAIEGSYDNVVGLPLTELYLMMEEMKSIKGIYLTSGA